ncbi:hypothetical protein [Nesterenkonia flava]|uniref:ATP/GTP-binding protein n=1 Tax=Nesterenkonia flava TaxID=469799 RepID=A0ABU1FS17_9MICC|nr:hypothetical protein [Nesterenkonia flava]MDR5711463.1 hypothetical protein [Nesterenkonia flava]
MGRGKKRSAGGSKWQREHRPLSPGLFAPGGISTGVVRRRDGEYHVRYISGSAATKTYTCPGCGLSIAAGTAHVVAWRADSIMGDEFAASERRHWHSQCWRIA